MSVVHHGGEKKTPRTHTVDAHSYMARPLDFSFYKLISIEDVIGGCPREKGKKGEGSQPITEDKKSKSQCLLFNNNDLNNIKQLSFVAEKILINPAILGWIDLSFNELPDIDPVLLEFENLEILYLHGNAITVLQQVDKLQKLKHLKKLTLHGNPVEEVTDYKNYVLSLMPNLLLLDFVRITKANLTISDTWNKMNNPKQKQQKKKKAKNE